KETELKNIVKKENIKNVLFLGEIQKEQMNRFFALADCGIIPLKNSNIFRETIPSKLFDYMSAELPIILGVEGEAKKILEKSQAGVYYEPDNFKQLAEKIIFLKTNKKMLKEMSSKGREFVEKNFNRTIIAKEIERELSEIFHK
ncbi:MAG: glycosyltransferase WbuB, partial [Candidatus Cloacimonas sp. 4484_275]